jgi:hypothetical protein
MGRNDKKRGRRTDKKEHRRQKPDEVVKVGPLQIARFGQFAHGQVKWDPAEYAKMRTSLPGRREELKNKIVERGARSPLRRCATVAAARRDFACLADPDRGSMSGGSRVESSPDHFHDAALLASSGIFLVAFEPVRRPDHDLAVLVEREIRCRVVDKASSTTSHACVEVSNLLPR